MATTSGLIPPGQIQFSRQRIKGAVLDCGRDGALRHHPKIGGSTSSEGQFLSRCVFGESRNTRRAIDLHEGDEIDEKALMTLIRAAAALNTKSAIVSD